MTSGYIPPKGEPDPDEILAVLREALDDNPQLAEMPEEEVAHQLVMDGHLEDKPSPPLVAEALRAIKVEEGSPT